MRSLNDKKAFSEPRISVIIAFYKRIDFLDLILDYLNVQSNMHFELIIAEDCNDKETVEYIGKKQSALSYPILHVFQDDIGFRKNRILNAALRIATTDKLVFLDGDCIPHKEFVDQYIKNLAFGIAGFGRRVMLGQEFTSALLKSKYKFKLSLKSILFSDSKKIEESIYLPLTIRKRADSSGIWGCNWGIMKDDLLRVNGFDEDYVHACVGEDLDVEHRLKLNGIRFKSLKNRAIVYHLYHKENYSKDAFEINKALFMEKCKANNCYCRNGIDKLNTELLSIK